MSDDHEHLLSLLEAHGREFLGSFAQSETNQRRRKSPCPTATPPAKHGKPTDESAAEEEGEEEEEEWLGFGTEVREGQGSGESEWDEFEDTVEDDGFTASAAYTSQPEPAVVIFSDTSKAQESTPKPTKSQVKAFMSSKVSKLRADLTDATPTESTANDGDPDDDRTNLQNDTELHKLIHTQLLSGSLNRNLGLSSAQRKKALAGRVLELAGEAKLGYGEKAVRNKERDKAAKRVREGIKEKQVEWRGKQLDEAKEMGNYHRTIKRLFEDPEEQRANRKRIKGLGMGVGKFGGGVLKLSQREINSVNGALPRRGGSSGRGRRRKG